MPNNPITPESIKSEQEAVEKFNDRFNWHTDGSYVFVNPQGKKKVEVFIKEVWSAASRETNMEVIRQLEQIDKYDSLDVVALKFTQYLAELKAKYLSGEEKTT